MMYTVKVTFEDGDNFVTGFNASSREGVLKYYMGNTFFIEEGQGKKAIKVEFI